MSTNLSNSCAVSSWLHVILPDAVRFPARCLPDSFRIPARCLPDSFRIPARRFPYSLRIPPRCLPTPSEFSRSLPFSGELAPVHPRDVIPLSWAGNALGGIVVWESFFPAEVIPNEDGGTDQSLGGTPDLFNQVMLPSRPIILPIFSHLAGKCHAAIGRISREVRVKPPSCQDEPPVP